MLDATSAKPLERVRVTLQGAAPEFVFGAPPTFEEGVTDAQGRFTVGLEHSGKLLRGSWSFIRAAPSTKCSCFWTAAVGCD